VLMNRFLRWIDENRAERLVPILKPHIHGSTLDVGCWNGDVIKRLGHKPVIGIDIVDPPQPQIEVMRFDGIHIPFPDKTFDTVLCSTMLHHAQKPDLLLEEMKRVGRKLVVLEDSVDTFLEKASVVLLHAIGSRLVKMPYRLSGFRSRESWHRFFEEFGLKVISCTRHPGIQPFWLFLRHYLFILEPL
jgi:ubiquinone/menaquinone biosynthesis C-methylase UbiE